MSIVLLAIFCVIFISHFFTSYEPELDCTCILAQPVTAAGC